jgi:DNA-directed RNA polymerase subunit RPC12/RpoP
MDVERRAQDPEDNHMSDAPAAKRTKVAEFARREPALFLTGVAVALCAVALFAPWWTAEAEFGGKEESSSARPFDDGDNLVKDGEASTAGLLVLAALAGLGGGAYLLWTARRASGAPKPFTPLLILGGSAGLALALVLAVTSWPRGDVSFWDTVREDLGGTTVTATVRAGLGWYMAALAVIAGLAGGSKSRALVAVPGAVPPVPGAPSAPQASSYSTPPAAIATGSPYPPPSGPVFQAPPPPAGFGVAPSALPSPASAPVAGTLSSPPTPPGAGLVVPSVPVAAPHQPGLQFQCPRCGTRVASPPHRPVEMACPTCQYQGLVTG